MSGAISASAVSDVEGRAVSTDQYSSRVKRRLLMTQPSNPHISHPRTPPKRAAGRRWLLWAIGAAVVVSALIAVAATILLPLMVRALRLETEIWAEESGLPVSPRFRYLLFPTHDAIAYDDAALSQNPAVWERVLLNEVHEQDARAISARDARTDTLRYVDGASMALLPADPADCHLALMAFVELVGRKHDPRIERLRFDMSEQDEGVLVKLEVADTRFTNIYEYSVADGTVIPRRWTRRSRDW